MTGEVLVQVSQWPTAGQNPFKVLSGMDPASVTPHQNLKSQYLKPAAGDLPHWSGAEANS